MPPRSRTALSLFWFAVALLSAGVVWLALTLSGAVDGTRALVIVAWIMVILSFAVRLWARRVKGRR